MGDAQHTGAPGRLELLPGSWLLTLIRILPVEDLVSLFRTSRQLASVVMQCAAKVTLKLPRATGGRLTRQLTAGEAEARRIILTQLVKACHELNIVVDFYDQSPVPYRTSVSSNIVVLDIQCGNQARDGRDAWIDWNGSACIDWNGLSRLTELVYSSSSRSSEQDLSRLCDALEAGQLQRLQRVSLEASYSARPSEIVWARLARALGQQVTELTTNVPSLLSYLHQFVALQAVSVMPRCKLTAAQAQLLCEHPNLQRVTLGINVRAEGDHSQRMCSWRLLVMSGYDLGHHSNLPLAGVQQICAVGVTGWIGKDRDMIKTLLAQPANKLICEPRKVPWEPLPEFRVLSASSDVVPLVATLQVACNLWLRYDPEHAGVVHEVWKALPACVQAVTLDCISEVDWVHLWQDLPAHVHTLQLLSCRVPTQTLCELVRRTPATSIGYY